MKVLLAIICLLLAANLYIGIEDRQRHQREEERRVAAEKLHKIAVDTAVNVATEVNKQREEILASYSRSLDSEETKSVYHQIYHANTAQMKLQSLSVQELQLVIQLLVAE